jgi:hypothetical protein
MNSRVPVSIQWREQSEEFHSEETFTRVISPYGCLVVLPKSMALQQQLSLTNLATRTRTAARVVWVGTERSDGWELGLVLEHPPTDFWGLEL